VTLLTETTIQFLNFFQLPLRVLLAGIKLMRCYTHGLVLSCHFNKCLNNSIDTEFPCVVIDFDIIFRD